MDTAALIVSVVAVLFAGLGWLEARHSAKASERSANAAEESAREAAEVAKIEKERRHDEREPEWEISASEIADELVEFTFTVTGPSEVYGVAVDVLPGSVVPFIRTERNGMSSVQSLRIEEARVGVDSLFYGNTDKKTRGDMRVVASFENADGTWRSYREFTVKWRPRVHFL